MKTVLEDKTIIEFRNPVSINEPIVVHRSTPENEDDVIGQVYRTWNEDDATVLYQCIGDNGESICEPTSEWVIAEQAFIRYAKNNPHKSILEKSIDNGKVLTWNSVRNKELQILRRDKGRNNKAIGISK